MIFCLTSVLNGMGRHCSFVESLRGASGLVHLGALDPRPVYGGPKATSGPLPRPNRCPPTPTADAAAGVVAPAPASSGGRADRFHRPRLRRPLPTNPAGGTTHGAAPGRSAGTGAPLAAAG